jgi:hypothetical protein
MSFSNNFPVVDRRLIGNEFLGSLGPYQISVMLLNALSKFIVNVKFTLRLAVYSQTVRLGDRSLETHEERFLFQTELLR